MADLQSPSIVQQALLWCKSANIGRFLSRHGRNPLVWPGAFPGYRTACIHVDLTSYCEPEPARSVDDNRRYFVVSSHVLGDSPSQTVLWGALCQSRGAYDGHLLPRHARNRRAFRECIPPLHNGPADGYRSGTPIALYTSTPGDRLSGRRMEEERASSGVGRSHCAQHRVKALIRGRAISPPGPLGTLGLPMLLWIAAKPYAEAAVPRIGDACQQATERSLRRRTISSTELGL
jgi:hypothetical protein